MGQLTRLDAWLERLDRLHPVKIDLGLDRVATVLRALRLETPPYVVVTVAGTNGKGSSVAMLDAVYSAAGYLTGAYTSPHLVRFNERVRVGGSELSDIHILTALEAVEHARGGTSLSFFEFTTVAALLAFRRLGVQVALLEVGLGGRLDAVNAVDAHAALVTSIGLDHQNWLGNDREAIGREKAGVFRAGRPAIVADPAPPASLAETAQAVGAQLQCAGRQVRAEPGDGRWRWHGVNRSIDHLPMPALTGAFQLDNAVGVVAVVEALQNRLPVTDDALRSGLASARLEGRFQLIPGPVTWILDVAHNTDSAVALAANLAALSPAVGTFAVVGMLADKDADSLVHALAPNVDRWYAVTPPTSRAMQASAMAQKIAAQTGATPAEYAHVDAACNAALEDAAPGFRVIVTGSFYTVGAALEWLQR